MAIAITKVNSTYDFQKNAITHVKIDPMTTSARTTYGGTLGVGDVGIVVLDTTLFTYFIWNGTAWLPVGGYNYTGSGPITVSGGVISMSASGVTAGTYGSALQIPQITVDTFGRITAVSNLAASGTGSVFINPGSGISLSGVGTSQVPFVISTIPSYIRGLFTGSNGVSYDNTTGNFSMTFVPDGSETKVQGSSAIGVTGAGTIASPYVISNTGVRSIDTTFTGAVDLTTRYFKQGGNAFGALAILGTTDSSQLSFIQQNVEYMRINSTGVAINQTTVPGNVTIGTYKFGVAGNVHSSGWYLSGAATGTGNADAYFDANGILKRGNPYAYDILLVDKFLVGDVGKPQGGDGTYVNNSALTGLQVDQLQVYVDGMLLSYGLSDRFSYSFSGGTITFTSALKTGQAVIIYKLKPQLIAAPTTTTAAPLTFDTTLSFSSATQQSAWSITAQVGGTTSANTFAFNHITPTTGFPQDMDIYVAGVLKMVVSFPSDYLGQTCQFVNSPTTYTITFQNGSVFL